MSDDELPQEVLVQQAFWQGVLPATLAMGWGALLQVCSNPWILLEFACLGLLQLVAASHVAATRRPRGAL
jgi:hypothetical protein